MFIWAVETGFSIAQDTIVQDSVEKTSNLGNNYFIFGPQGWLQGGQWVVNL